LKRAFKHKKIAFLKKNFSTQWDGAQTLSIETACLFCGCSF